MRRGVGCGYCCRDDCEKSKKTAGMLPGWVAHWNHHRFLGFRIAVFTRGFNCGMPLWAGVSDSGDATHGGKSKPPPCPCKERRDKDRAPSVFQKLPLSRGSLSCWRTLSVCEIHVSDVFGDCARLGFG